MYRSQDLKKANDARKMELIKVNDTDAFSIEVNGGLPVKEFTFEDTSVKARQTYYFGVVAVGLSDEGKWLPSRVSQVLAGQAWDSSRPIFNNYELLSKVDYKNESIALFWLEASGDFECELSRSPGWGNGESRYMEYDVDEGQYLYKDKEVDLAQIYQYQVTVRTSNGQEADIKVQAEVIS